MKNILHGIKYVFWVADLVGVAGLAFSGVELILFLKLDSEATLEPNQGSSNAQNSFQDIFWAVWFM